MRPVRRPSRSLVVLVAAALVVLVAALIPLAVTALTGPDDTGPALDAVLDGADRHTLDAVPVRRGAAPPPVDPAVDLADPAAVAHAYLTGARAAGPDDADRTDRRAAAYAAPDSPPATVGVRVLDLPPPGQVRTATVTALDLVAQDEADLRRGYRATVATTTGPPGPGGVAPSGTRSVTTSYVVLARQPDGHWLVAADSPDVLEGDD